MASYVKQWKAVCRAQGWEFHPDDGDGLAVIDRITKSRHASNPIYDNPDLSKEQENDYDRLNELLHTKLAEAARQHFRNTPLPPEYSESEDDSESAWETGTPFTYQNWDWYGPSYECYIAVLEAYLSTSLVQRFQELLVGELADFCVVLCAAADLRFDPFEAIWIYSDRVVVCEVAIEDIPAPQIAP